MNELYREFETVFDEIDNVFNQKKIPKLKVVFKGASTNIHNLVDMLIRKAVLKENLYTYEDKGEMVKFHLPDETKLSELEKPVAIYDRVRSLQRGIEFQINDLSDNVNTIDDTYIEHTLQILNFIAFQSYNSTSVSRTTLILQEMTTRVITGKDQIFSRIVVDNLKLLADNYKTINKINEELILLKKFKYMATLRLEIFPELPEQFTEIIFNENPTHYLEQIKIIINEELKDTKFHPNWTREAIKDFYINDDRQFLDRVKPLFLTERETKKAEAMVHSPREKLILIISNIARSHIFLEKIYFSMIDNLKLLQDHKKNFIESIVDMFNKLFKPNSSTEEEYFHIEYINPSTRKVEKDSILISEFMTVLRKKGSLFTELLKESSSVYDKISNATEESLYKFMEDTYFQLLLLRERITGINIELRLRLPRKTREQLKDITKPLEDLTDLLTQITGQRRKYVSEQDSFGHPKK